MTSAIAGDPAHRPHDRLADVRLLGLLACLYFAQGLPSGLLAKALPALLREHGVSLSAIGFTTLLAAPWALKFAWAPFLDRYGTRRQWLLGLNAVTLALMLLVASRDIGEWIDHAFAPLMVLLFLLNLVAATQDIATDGLAVSRLDERLRGIGNSVQIVGYKLGLIVGGGVLLVLLAAHGWHASYGGLALLMALAILPVLFMRESPRVVIATHSRWHGLRGYLHLFGDFAARPGLGWWLVAVACFKTGHALAAHMIGPMLADDGLSAGDYGALAGVTGAIAGIGGAFAGGILLLQIGHRTGLLLFGTLQALGLLAYLPATGGHLPSLPVLYAIVCAEQFADGLATVALFTAMMDVCRRASPGTDYTLQASLQVTLAGLAALGSGLFAQRAGYGAVFVTGALLTMLALLPVWLSFARRAPAGGAS